MPDSPLEILGPTLSRLSPAQRGVFESLTKEEIAFAAKLQQRLDAVTPEVEGQSNNSNNVC